MSVLIENSGTVSGSSFTLQDWTNAGSPASFEIRNYETVPERLFQGNTTITEIVFGAGVVTLRYVIDYAPNLVSITIGPDVTTVDFLVMAAPQFTTITLDSGNTTFHLDNGILYKKYGSNNTHTLVLYPVGKASEAFTIPSTVEIIGGGAAQSSNITSLNVPASVQIIRDSAFLGCFGLTSITFAEGSGLLTVEGKAFYATALASIAIPEYVASILGLAFSNSSLTTITVDSNNSTFYAENNTLYQKSGINNTHTLIQYPIGRTEVTYIIPNTVEIIGNEAFYDATNITSLEIPASVKTISFGSFVQSGITSFTFAEGSVLETIGGKAFISTAITSIIIPASVTSIGYAAFVLCASLTSVTFIASTGTTTGGVIGITIGDDAFANTTVLASVFIKDDQVIKDSSANAITTTLSTTGAFFGSSTSVVIRSYEIAGTGEFGSSDYTSAGSPPYTVLTGWTSIGADAFKDNTTLTSITIPNSVTSIGADAFANTGPTSTYMTSLVATRFSIVPFPAPTGSYASFFGSPNLSILEITPASAPPAPPAAICFPAGTPVLTDQGEIAIDKIDPEKHTIHANKIEGITKTTSIEDYVVMIKKDAFSEYVPCRDTLISANHKIVFNDQMIQAREFVDKKEFADKIYKVDYTGYPLYNVLLENVHCVMVVNNLIAETLSPTSVNAWLFRKMKSNLSSVERKEAMDAYMQRVFPTPVLSLRMIGCK